MDGNGGTLWGDSGVQMDAFGSDLLEIVTGWLGGSVTGMAIPAFHNVPGFLGFISGEGSFNFTSSGFGTSFAVGCETSVDLSGELSCKGTVMRTVAAKGTALVEKAKSGRRDPVGALSRISVRGIRHLRV